MRYSVHFAIRLEELPDETCAQIVQTFEQVAEAVSSVERASPFWTSIKGSVLQIDVAGWRLGYRLDQAREQIIVIEAQRLGA